VTLDEHVVDMHQLIDDFREWWLACHSDDPERFPLEQSEGDWMLQFDAYLETL
jgi:hypothetical protein